MLFGSARFVRRALGLLFATTFLFGTAAEAQKQLSMTGKFGSHKGPIVQVPQLGNTACLSHTIGLGAGQLVGTATPIWTNITGGTADPTPSPIFTGVPNGVTKFTGRIPANFGKPQFGNLNGCVKASVPVTGGGGGGAYVNTAVSPASFTVPVNAFSLPAPATKNVTPVPAAGVLQFGTQAALRGPFASPLVPINATAGAPAAQWRRFKKDAWMTQTGRPGANFTACWGPPPGGSGTPPGVVRPCAGVAGGTVPLIVKYHGSHANFGGTMGLLFDQTIAGGAGPGSLAISAGPGIGAGQLQIKFNSATATGLGGKGYRATQTQAAQVAILYTSFSTTSAPLPGGGSSPVLAGLGAATSTTTLSTLAQSIQFPLTAGSVLVRNTGGIINSVPQTVTLTAMGTDTRTPGGEGRIQLVSGGFINSIRPSESIDIVSLTFSAPATPNPVPVLPVWGLGVLATALGATGGGMFLRRRSNR